MLSTEKFLKTKKSSNAWQGLPWVIAAGLALRLIVAWISEYIFHPDEIFQYLEQAHRLVFGYGYTLWEYEHGIRSWLLPGLIALPLFVTKQLGLDDPLIYGSIIQFLACVISLAAIYWSYWIGREMISETVGRTACILVCAWYEMVMAASKVTPEVFGGYLMLGSIAYLVRQPTKRRALILGLCCGGIIMLRLQYAPIILCIGTAILWQHFQKQRSTEHIAFSILGFFSVVGFAGWFDYYTWGSFFASYYNSYLYNQVYKISSFFGEDPVWFYPLMLGAYSVGLFWVAIGYNLARKHKPWLILSLIGSVILAHSLIGHKEYRFIFAVIPLCLILSAITIVDLWQNHCRDSDGLLKYLPMPWHLGKSLAVAFTSISLIGLIAFGGFINRYYAFGFSAYSYLYKQPSVVAVLNLATPWYFSGGYYHLHRDVPIYFPKQIESIPANKYDRYISHILCERKHRQIEGFKTTEQFGQLEIRQNQSTPSVHLDIPTKAIPYDGFGALPKPRVNPRF